MNLPLRRNVTEKPNRVLTVVIPFTIYYVQHNSPYIEDKRYIESKFESHDKQLDRLTVILDRVTRKE